MSVSGPHDPLLRTLQSRRSRIQEVRYRENRSVLLSVSRDGRRLNSHACFRDAPAPIAEAVADFICARPRSATQRRALGVLRDWSGTHAGLEQARLKRPQRKRRLDGPDTDVPRRLFERFNRDRFDGRLPPIGLRISRRMTRSLGTITYETNGPRGVREIALCADLMLPENAGVLEDTLLHEMAHAEAWLEHGHRGHGTVWRRIAKRVGCTPRARTDTRVARERRRR